MNIEIQPEPQEKLSVTTLKVIAKKYVRYNNFYILYLYF